MCVTTEFVINHGPDCTLKAWVDV